MTGIEKHFVVVGDGMTGKTALLSVISEGLFPLLYAPTQLCALHFAKVKVSGKKVNLHIKIVQQFPIHI